MEGYRKFYAMIAIIVIGTILRISNLVNGAELIDLFKTCAVAFFGANLSEHIISGAKSYFDSKKGE